MLKAMRWLVLLAKILGLYIMRGVGIALCVIVIPIYSVFDRLNDFIDDYSSMLVDLRVKTYRKYKDFKVAKKC